ncbi:MAG: hypothetical protein U9R75_07410 [Candidatus Thermoplasmatota archaeon]|nr:hypothetical protein [Candidatus Thermoplasmatota archaeon]
MGVDMRIWTRMSLVLLLLITALHGFIDLQIGSVDALPIDYPIRISGGYAEELPGSTIYVDDLQPGQTENYLIHLDNPEQVEIRYRITITNVPEDWVVFLGDNLVHTMYVDLDALESRATALFLKNLKEGTADIGINVTNENSGEYWSITLRIICQLGPLVIDLGPGSYILGRDAPVDIPFEVENIGDTVLNVSLGIDGFIPSSTPIPSSWTVRFSERAFFLPPGARKSITATVWSPEFEPIGSQKVTTIQGSVEGVSRPYLSTSFTVRVSTIYDLRATVTPIGYQKVDPGVAINFDLILENWATETDYVIINEYSTPSGWMIGWDDEIDPTLFSISISPESSRTFHPKIYVPLNAIAGKHNIIMKADGEANVTDIVLKVEVARNDEIEALSSPSRGGSTYRMTIGDNNIPFIVRNRGNFYDTVTLEVENRPVWAPSFFYRIKVGAGDATQSVSGKDTLNISSMSMATYEFEEENLDKITLALAPSQTLTVVMISSVPMDELPNDGVIGIKYRYGVLGNQKLLQMPLKLIIVDLEIVDLDMDGLPDLNVWPVSDHDPGDRVRFTFDLKNNYPFATREGDVEYKIELSGAVLVGGDVGVIQPGETKRFNITWNADVSTKLRLQAYLNLYGDVYYNEDNAPSARTDEDIFVRSGEVNRPWGYMIAFAIFMLIVILAFIGFWIASQKNVKERERAESEKYDAVYGSRRRELRGGRRAGLGRGVQRSLGPGKRPSLPSKTMDDEQPEKRASSGKPIAGKRKRTSDAKGKERRTRPERKKRSTDLEELETLEELEET